VRTMAVRPSSDTTLVGSARPASAGVRLVYAAALVGFPLLWVILAGTDIHPDPSGETASEQVRAVAASADRWRWVHLLLAGASLLGMGAVLALRSLAQVQGQLSVIASISAALGVAAAGLVAGMLVMEATLVAPVARACAASRACLSAANEAFLRQFADSGWNDLTALSVAAGTLIFCLGTLAWLGWAAKNVRTWEAVLMAVGIVGIYATNTVLHGDAKYGLALVLVAGASIAYRMVRRGRHG
jgi:hypothetical protein